MGVEAGKPEENGCEKNSASAKDSGGGGGGPSVSIGDDPKYIKGDAVLLRRAARRRWDVPEQMKHLVKETAVRLMASDDDRAMAAGAKVVLAMNDQDISDDHHEDRLSLDREKLDKGIGDTNVNVKLYDTRAPVEDV